MKTVVSALLVTVFFVNSTTAQEATREEFVEFCKAIQGRWIGDITWAADWPGLGKKGERVTTYWEGTITEDGNALHGKFYGGSGSGTSLIVFDAGAKQINGLWINSGGSVNHDMIFKKDGKWVQVTKGSHLNGEKTEGTATLTIEENGSKHTWRGSGTIAGKKHDDYADVWRRLSK